MKALSREGSLFAFGIFLTFVQGSYRAFNWEKKFFFWPSQDLCFMRFFFVFLASFGDACLALVVLSNLRKDLVLRTCPNNF